MIKLIAKYVFTISCCKVHRFAEHIEANNKLIKEREREKGHDLFLIECFMIKLNKDFIRLYTVNRGTGSVRKKISISTKNFTFVHDSETKYSVVLFHTS